MFFHTRTNTPTSHIHAQAKARIPSGFSHEQKCAVELGTCGTSVPSPLGDQISTIGQKQTISHIAKPHMSHTMLIYKCIYVKCVSEDVVRVLVISILVICIFCRNKIIYTHTFENATHAECVCRALTFASCLRFQSFLLALSAQHTKHARDICQKYPGGSETPRRQDEVHQGDAATSQ